MNGAWRGVALRVALAAAAVGLLLAVRPGVVLNGVRSPRVWLVVLGLLVAGRVVALLVRRTTGRPRLASATSTVLVLTAVALLLAPSFRQRTLIEPFPLSAPVAAPVAASLAPPAPTGEPEPAASPVRPTSAAVAAAPAPARAAPRQAAAPAPATSAPPRTAAPPPPPSAAAPAPATAPQRKSAGRLRGIDHSASGGTALYEVDGRGVLRFEDIDVEGNPGPEVHLVRRGARTPEGGLPLGPLKAERGSFSYALPASVDLDAAWTVLVWCRPYDTPIAASDH